MSNKFLQEFEKNVVDTVKKYKLISPKDKVLVAVSGGKDSTVVLYILNKYFKNIEAITIDAAIGNYSKKSLENIQKFCKEIGIKLHVYGFKKEFGYSLCYIRDVLKSKGHKMNSCTICGIFKRYILNKKSRVLKGTKLVTGHNLDDEAQSIMMNVIRGNTELLSRLGPKTGMVSDKRFVPRIKPLYFCSEKDVEKYSKLMKFPVDYSRCPCSVDAYRNTMRNLLLNEKVKANIVKFFIRNSDKIKKEYASDKVPNYCKKCGEVAKGEKCKACEIIGLLKG